MINVKVHVVSSQVKLSNTVKLHYVCAHRCVRVGDSLYIGARAKARDSGHRGKTVARACLIAANLAPSPGISHRPFDGRGVRGEGTGEDRGADAPFGSLQFHPRLHPSRGVSMPETLKYLWWEPSGFRTGV